MKCMALQARVHSRHPSHFARSMIITQRRWAASWATGMGGAAAYATVASTPGPGRPESWIRVPASPAPVPAARAGTPRTVRHDVNRRQVLPPANGPAAAAAPAARAFRGDRRDGATPLAPQDDELTSLSRVVRGAAGEAAAVMIDARARGSEAEGR